MRAYNYILDLNGADYFMPFADALNEKKDVWFGSASKMDNQFLQYLHRIHYSNKINRLFRLPFKSIWFPLKYNGKVTDDKPIIYITYVKFLHANRGDIDLDKKFIHYIKQKNPANRVVVFCGDIIEKTNLSEPEKTFSMYDLVCSFDAGDCKKYGLKHMPVLYRTPQLPISTPESFKYDVFFNGVAKNRLDNIHSAWFHFQQMGLKTCFIIVNAPMEKRIEGEGLIYIDGRIPYLECLEYIQQSRCILEITQANSVALTLRPSEAVCYKRKLISNAPALLDGNPLYCPENMQYFQDIKEITKDFVTSPIDYKAYERVKTLTADDFLDRIDELITEKENETKL